MSPTRRFQWRVIVPTAVLTVAGMLVWWVLIGPSQSSYRDAQGPEPTVELFVIQTPSPSEWAVLAASSDPASVAVQTFQAGRVIRFGTGTVVSSDGLIVTVIDVVPFTSPSATYQITLPERVVRAHVVRRDFNTNLALLKANVSDLTIAQMTQTRPLVGSPLAIVGGLVDVSSYTPYFLHAWLSYDLNRYGILDASVVPTMAGGRAVTPDGRQVGMVFLRQGQVRLLWTEQIELFVEAYLQSLSLDQ